MKYKISIIIPFYNSESYLEDAINSVINQTIGFDNIQLILVNDGSKDNSEKIALKYKEIYNNIIYICQENSGVSAARNTGLKYVDGKYINFIDSDDKWDKEALLNMYNFIEENYQEIDFVSGRVKNFEANEDYHYLDYKFEKTRVVDIEKEPEMITMHVASALFKTEIIRNMKFDTNLKIGEDNLFINTLLLNKLKYGVVREAVYNYRKRNTNNSTIQSMKKSKAWYIDTPKYAWNGLIEASNKKCNRIIKYIQNILLYELKWRIKCEYIVLNCIEIKKHIEEMIKVAKCIEDDTIEKYRLLDSEEINIIKELKIY